MIHIFVRVEAFDPETWDRISVPILLDQAAGPNPAMDLATVVTNVTTAIQQLHHASTLPPAIEESPAPST